MGTALERRVRRYIEWRELLRAGDRALAAVSGGADSTALLLILSRLRPVLGVELKAAHFDHGLRGGEASRREKEFVSELAARVGVEVITGAGDVRAHARQTRASIEEAARELRYRFLASAAREWGATVVVTGHTADDQTETVLMNILRGTGPSGLAGMLPGAAWPYPAEGTAGLRLIRPLLDVRRAETAAYCEEVGVRPLEDVSNRSLAYRRNRIRRELLPMLRRYNPRIDEALRRLAGSAAAEREALEWVAAAALPDILRLEGGAARVSRAGLRAQPVGLRLHILRAVAARLLGDVQDIGWPHWEAMASALDKPVGTALHLPRGLRVQVEYDDLVLIVGPPAPLLPPLPTAEVMLAVPGRTEVAGWLFDARLVEGPVEPPTSPYLARLDADALQMPLGVRRRRPGDRLRPFGLSGGEKKLQDLLVDAKVPRAERDRVPVVCDRAGIVWVVGHGIAERGKMVASTRHVVELRATARWRGGDREMGVGS